MTGLVILAINNRQKASIRMDMDDAPILVDFINRVRRHAKRQARKRRQK